MEIAETEAERRPWGRRGTAGATIAARLSFQDIHFDYSGLPALTGVSLDVEPGEILCLLGRSGCGKTTLLKVAAGLERQSGGRVLINGQEIAGPARFVAPEKRGIGLMFQDYALFPHMTILANVRFGLTSLPRGDAIRESRRVLGRVGLEHDAEDYPHSLSGGEQQRVALARAIVPRPSVLLMDEPFSGLDRSLRESVRDETLAVLRETRATCIIVTHDPEEAMRLGDRIALMRDGRILQLGTAHELYDHPIDLEAARFFSDFNEFEGIVEHGEVRTPLGPIAAHGFAGGTPVRVGVRPTGVRILPPTGPNLGRVIARHFLGTVEHVDVAVEGVEAPIRARLRDPGGILVGAEVGLGADPRDVHVFAKPVE